VSIRSSSFFQAASTLQGLQGHLAEAVACIQGLRQELAAADVQLYSTAAAVQALQARRDNLHDTLDITKVWSGGWGAAGGQRVEEGTLAREFGLVRWHVLLPLSSTGVVAAAAAGVNTV
jgi:multidrug resistance efflux pump